MFSDPGLAPASRRRLLLRICYVAEGNGYNADIPEREESDTVLIDWIRRNLPQVNARCRSTCAPKRGG